MSIVLHWVCPDLQLPEVHLSIRKYDVVSAPRRAELKYCIMFVLHWIAERYRFAPLRFRFNVVLWGSGSAPSTIRKTNNYEFHGENGNPPNTLRKTHVIQKRKSDAADSNLRNSVPITNMISVNGDHDPPPHTHTIVHSRNNDIGDFHKSPGSYKKSFGILLFLGHS